jgi:uncharacterized protein
MRKLIFTLCTSLIALISYAQTGDKNFIDQNYIEVKAYAEKQITPDRIYLNILINEKDIKGKTVPEIEKSMFDKLQEMGIDIQKDIAIKDFVSNFKHYWILKTDIRFIKEYQLIVRDAKLAGHVFIELEKLGISNISINKFEHSEIEKFKNEIRMEAIKSAKQKASDLTTSIGQDIGRALYIFENSDIDDESTLHGQVAGLMIRGYSAQGIYGSRAPDPDIEFEKIKLEYDVTVRFELK